MFGRRQNGNVVPLLPDTQTGPESEERHTAGPQPVSKPTARVPAAQALAENKTIQAIVERALPKLRQRLEPRQIVKMTRSQLAQQVGTNIDEICLEDSYTLEGDDQRNAITVLVQRLTAEAKRQVRGKSDGEGNGASSSKGEIIDTAKQLVQPILLERIDVTKALQLPPEELARQISDIVAEILGEEKHQLNQTEQRDLVTALLNDMLGLGPLEVLLKDDTVTDVLVNGPKQVYVERRGKLELTDVTFRDNAHLMNICSRIVTRVGRRIDETTPLVDARLQDGSRVNIIIPPLALDGASISIRKFAKQKITLDMMEKTQNLSPQMATVLKIAGRCQLNILISGGTGSGKTTLLNAMSQMIDIGERIVTIEDAAELQLQQPHVVRLETRPPNLEGQGEITQRDLVKNALRMRPDRVILGEIRAGEALDMLQAMNTGHDGSMCTVHANRPREALTRLENMVAMTGVKLPNEAVRSQIAGAVQLIIQIARMRDGVRRITYITEVVGMEGDVITTQDLFKFEFEGEDESGRLFGNFRPSGLRPHFTPRAEYYGLARALMEAVADDGGGRA